MIFDIDEGGLLIDGPYNFLVECFILLMLGQLLMILLYYHRYLSTQEKIALYLFLVFSLFMNVLQRFLGSTIIYLSNHLALLLIFLLLHGKLKHQLGERERELTEYHMRILVSQIQPHFIYNTLGTISQLCVEQPEKAAKLTTEFSLYLRGNFSEWHHRGPVSLSTELELVKHYVEIERVRFPDIQILFDIRTEGFLLPALSVQPLVENAVKHGLMGLESGGTVWVSAYETEKEHCVCVRDNGVGFDVGSVPEDGEHLGIQSIRGRLAIMCRGRLEVASQPGKGTTAVIKIPRRTGDAREASKKDGEGG